METLPPELRIYIFQKLPPKEVYRLRILSKATAQFIESHRSQLARPTFSIAVGQAPEDKFIRKCGMVTITTPKTAFRLVIDKRDNLSLLQVSNASKDFIVPFYDYANQRAPASQKSLFLKWLFKKADIENFEIIPYENWLDLAAWVSAELKLSGARCENILLRHEFRLFNLSRANTWVFFPQFCEQRKNLGTPVKLHVHPRMYDELLVSPNHPEYLHIYNQWFSDVMFTFNYKLLFAPLFAIASKWVESELNSINYRIRIDFSQSKLQNLQILGDSFKRKFLRLDLYLDDINDRELDNYIGISPQQMIPERIECNQNNGRGFLIFKFTKFTTHAMLTAEFR